MIAREYQRAFHNLLDLIQEGNVGLLEAVKNFDPYRGIRFPSYAVWWIRAYIIRYIMNNWRLVKVGTTQAQRKLFFNLAKERDRLEREGFSPTPKLIAQRLDVREKEVVEMEQRLAARDVSVDTPVGEGEDATLLDFLPSREQTAEAVAASGVAAETSLLPATSGSTDADAPPSEPPIESHATEEPVISPVPESVPRSSEDSAETGSEGATITSPQDALNDHRSPA